MHCFKDTGCTTLKIKNILEISEKLFGQFF